MYIIQGIPTDSSIFFQSLRRYDIRTKYRDPVAPIKCMIFPAQILFDGPANSIPITGNKEMPCIK